CAAAVLAGLGRVLPAAGSRRTLLGTFAALACFSFLLMIPRIHPLALFALAAGVGLQAGRWLADRPAAVRRWARATTLPLAALILAAAAVVNVRFMLRDRASLHPAVAAPAGAPNVLLIIWDTVRSASLSLYGYERPTSTFLSEFARTGVVFDWAFTTAPWTLAAHGSLFTGHYPFDLTAGWDVPLDGRHATLAEELAARGFATGGFNANHIFGPAEYGLGRGFGHYEARPLSVGRVLTASPVLEQLFHVYRHRFDPDLVLHEWSGENVAASFWRWRERVGARPYFAFLNFFDAHEPYTPPAPFDTLFGRPDVRRVIVDRRPTDGEVRDLRDAYDGAIAYLDDQLRQLIGELERRGELDRTLIIIASDHGEHLGEHGLLDHGNTLYSPLLRVPLVIRMPGRVPADRRIQHAISLRDLPRTVFDLVGVRPAVDFPGRSLARFWTGDGAAVAGDTVLAQVPFAPGQPDWYPLAAGDIRSVLLWPLQLIVDGRGEEQVFDLAEDPAGLRDIAAQVAPGDLERLRAALAAFPARARVENAAR
ncbi:MAG TPA: sulfatase, partial [Longimicrobiales bacterium]